MVERNPDGTIKSGVLNPAGKPAGVRHFTTKVKEALEKIADGKEYTYEEALVKSVLKKAIVDQDPRMIKLIWNYLDGMPKQDIEANITGGISLSDLFNKAKENE